MSSEQPLQKTGQHGPLHGRQTWSELNSFNRGVDINVPGRGYVSAVSSQNGETIPAPSPPHSLNDSVYVGAVVEIGKNPGSKHQIQPGRGE